jgi:hypothetical protein
MTIASNIPGDSWSMLPADTLLWRKIQNDFSARTSPDFKPGHKREDRRPRPEPRLEAHLWLAKSAKIRAKALSPASASKCSNASSA